MVSKETSSIFPLFVLGYLGLGFLCIKSPIRVKPFVPLVPDKDVVQYENARFLQNTGGADNIHKAIKLYRNLIKKGYYEVLDILISIYYYGVPDIIEKDKDITERLFSLRVKVDQMFQSVNITYEPKFLDAVCKDAFMKTLRLTEVKEKAKYSVKSDKQNTHDSGVTNSVRITLERLKKVTKMTSAEKEALDGVRKWICHNSGKLDKKQMTCADRVLDKIASNTEKLESVDMTEMEILCLLYNRINDDVNRENRNTMIENLTEELADSQDAQGYLYCTVGRISRMVNSLNVLDSEVTIKPKWAIRQEMLQDASTLKERMVESLPEQTQKRLNNDVQFSDKFDERFRELLWECYRLTYVESGIMKQEELEEEVNGWIDYV